MNSFAWMFEKLGWVEARKSLQILAVTLGLLLFCLPGFAQLNLGRLFGGISDQTGGAVVGATVTVIDETRGIARPLVSDGAGEYAAPNLIPGPYTVRAEAAGFKIAEHTGVVVGVGSDIRVDLTLQPGAQTQTVTVTGDLPMVNTSNAQLGGTLENQSIDQLPVNGRNYSYLLQTRPGVLMKQGGGQNVWTTNGTGINDTNSMIDGVTDFSLFDGTPNIIGGTRLGADEANILSIDAIQEVSIVMAPKAEFGNRIGAQINIGLKSGTNGLHGTAIAFGRDGSWDAKNPFQPGSLPKAPLAMKQYGASLGGPIKKDKLFYFLDYEGQRFSVGTPKIVQEPSTASGGGVSASIPDAVFDILHNAANTTRIPSALSLNILGCQGLVPAGSVGANGQFTAAQITALKAQTASQLAAGCTAGTGVFSNAGPNANYFIDQIGTGGSDNGLVKVDYHPNDHHSFNAEYFTGGGTQLNAGSVIQPYWDAIDYTWGSFARGVWIWTPGSAITNEVRFGYEYLNAPIYSPDCAHNQGPDFASLGVIIGAQPCDPSNAVNSKFPVTTISGFSALGVGGFTTDRLVQYYTFLDNLSYTRGRHLFKFGGEIRPQYFNGDALKNNSGTLTFGSVAAFTGASALEDFMAGVPATGIILLGDELRVTKSQEFAVYAQDDWRILNRLTLNIGLRYEYNTVLKDKNNLLANFDPSATTPTGLIQATNSKGVYTPFPYAFEPRFGFAWDVFGNGKTVVRGGMSILYDSTLPLRWLMSGSGGAGVINANPTGFTFYNPNGSTFAGPGTIETGNISLITSQIPWAINTPIFNSTPSGLVCGNGASTASAPGGAAPGAPATNPAPCLIQGVDLKLVDTEGIPRTLGIQHAFTNNLSLDVEYSGLHAPHIISFGNFNNVPPGAKNTSADGNIEQRRRPYYTQYPFYSQLRFQASYGWSNYNALQVTLNERVARGLNFAMGYTLSHNLDTGGSQMQPGNTRLDYGTSTNDVRNVFTFTATYAIPGRKSPGQILEAWRLNTSVYFQSGTPVNPTDSTNDVSGTGILADRWTLAGNQHDFKIGGPGPTPCWGVALSSFAKSANCSTVATVANMPSLCQSTAAAEAVNPNLPAGTPAATGLQALSTYGCYMMGASVIVPPGQGTFGTMGPNELLSPPYRNWDVSVTKDWKFAERYGIQFRAEFFNVLNRTRYAGPSSNLAAPGNFGQSSATPDAGSNPVIGPGPRKIQLGVKLSF